MTDLTLIIGNKNYSSWSLRSWLAMKQAKIDFTEKRILLDTPTTYQEIRRYSPAGKVPVLQHNQLTVWDSLAICEYVAECFAPTLWPEDRVARAVARSVSAEMHSGFMNLRQSMPMDCRARQCVIGINPALQADIDRIISIWHNCRQKFGAGGDFLFGRFSIADAMYAPAVSRFITYDVQLDSVAQAYAKAIYELPAMQEWVEAASCELESIPNFYL
ncbi:MAG: glutathione S-transferase family protein [Coleofasciculaceae cyanobacterium]